MFSRSNNLIQRLLIDLPSLRLNTKEDNEARELFLDQIGTSISSGGRGILLLYIMGVIFIPMIFRTLPRFTIRIPMTLGFIGFHENIYYFGANLMLKMNVQNIIHGSLVISGTNK